MSKVLILCPTFDHVDTLFASIASVQMQTFREWELVVIGDGAPDRTFEIVEAIAARDRRITAERHPKGERFGEAYRDPVIRASDAEFVCHLNDDDLWTPTHLAEMVGMLEMAEYATQGTLRFLPDNRSRWLPFNQGTPACRDAARRRFSINTGINYVAYRREAYLRLPEGWTPAPPEAAHSDRYMWAKFFRLPDLSVASTAQATAIKLPSNPPEATERTPVERLAARMPFVVRLSDPDLAPGIRRTAVVGPRLARLFALHDGDRCGSLEDAYAAAGLAPADADTPSRPAVDGAPMILPLTEAQRQEGWLAWAMLRGYATAEGEPLRRAVRDALGSNSRRWRTAIKALMEDRPEAASRAASDFADACPGDPAAERIAEAANARVGKAYQPVASPNE